MINNPQWVHWLYSTFFGIHIKQMGWTLNFIYRQSGQRKRVHEILRGKQPASEYTIWRNLLADLVFGEESNRDKLLFVVNL